MGLVLDGFGPGETGLTYPDRCGLEGSSSQTGQTEVKANYKGCEGEVQDVGSSNPFEGSGDSGRSGAADPRAVDSGVMEGPMRVGLWQVLELLSEASLHGAVCVDSLVDEAGEAACLS
ncbi:hypothetical protein H920_18434 [Fukomys damarensis]|uniref:Uncharacterized protein n=1 Tax=Fukomys damarensis TaxID=885580 RepID=A0A091CQY7_FUKDA|nr:hypothetical protein H920_18434 [Fukomys damarensis]